ncbi:ribosome biogenesis GTPase Der, partial [Francisella tularensis subsp. holarctica]|nr:ribosome biogenesis GTPase Der [Francisella tularensis subsp. holarctica]
FDEFMAKQSQIAIDEANLVFFVVDGRSGLTTGDEYVASLLRQTDKKVVVGVNKVDGTDEEAAMAEFYSFGFDKVFYSFGFDKVFAISAAHRRNTQ